MCTFRGSLRIHFIEIFCQHLYRCIPIILLSIPLQTVLIFELALITCGLFHHSNLYIPHYLSKHLDKIIVLPTRHCVHHHSRYTDWNSNFGFIFIWWDKLFNTFNDSLRKPSWRIGLGYSPDLDIINLLLSPFIFKKLRYRMKDKKHKLMTKYAESNS